MTKGLKKKTIKKQELAVKATFLDPHFQKSVFKNGDKFDEVYCDLIGQIQSVIRTKQSELCILVQPQVTPGTLIMKLWGKFDKKVVQLTAKNDP